MANPAILREGEITVEALAKMLNLSPTRVSQLAQTGILPRPGRGAYPMVECVRAYCQHLQGLTTGGDAGVGLSLERTRLARAQAERIELELAEKRRQLAPMEVIVAVISRCAAQAADVLDAVPVAILRRVPDVDHRVLRVVEQEIFRARTIAAGAKVPDSFDEPLLTKPDRKALA